MKEIEVKILENSHLKIEKKLFSLGAKKIFEGELHANFYDNSDNLIKSKNEVLRLRKEGDKQYLTHKKKISNNKVKIAEEIEFEVSDFNKADLFLKSLNYNKIKENRKIRVSYIIEDENIKFDFDKYLDNLSFIPEFFEIEADSIKKIYKYVKLLGFEKKDCYSFNTKELENYYFKKGTN